MVNIFASILTTMDLFFIIIFGVLTFVLVTNSPLTSIFPGIILILFCIFIYQDFNSIFSNEPMDTLQFLRGLAMLYILGPIIFIFMILALIFGFASSQ